jgi:hypothetical protein
MTPEIVQGIMALRRGTESDGRPFVIDGLPDLYRVPGMTEQLLNSLKGQIGFRSSVFSARVTCRSRNVVRRVRYVLERGAGGTVPALITWWEEGGAFGLPQPAEGL